MMIRWLERRVSNRKISGLMPVMALSDVVSLGKTLRPNANFLTDTLCGRLPQVSILQWKKIKEQMKTSQNGTAGISKSGPGCQFSYAQNKKYSLALSLCLTSTTSSHFFYVYKQCFMLCVRLIHQHRSSVYHTYTKLDTSCNLFCKTGPPQWVACLTPL